MLLYCWRTQGGIFSNCNPWSGHTTYTILLFIIYGELYLILITKWMQKILEVNSSHVKNEFELTTDLEALHSQVA